MQYSTTPFPNPNGDHLGFIAVVVVMFIISVFLLWSFKEKEITKTQFVASKIAVFVVLVITGYISFFDLKPVPANTQVIATRVGFGESMGSGKYPTMNSTVMYETPEGIVSFGMGHGRVWPDKVILYRK